MKVHWRKSTGRDFRGWVGYSTSCGYWVDRTNPDTTEDQSWATTANPNKVTCQACKAALAEPENPESTTTGPQSIWEKLLAWFRKNWPVLGG